MTNLDMTDYYLKRKEKFKENFVYAIFVDIHDLTYVKIGRTSDVSHRAYMLQIGCPFPVRSIYACDVIERKEADRKERLLHKHYSANHLRGEWFTPFKGIASDQDSLAFETEMLSLASIGMPGVIFSYRWTPKRITNKNIRLVKTQITPEEAKILPFFAMKDPIAKAKAIHDLKMADLDPSKVPINMRKGRRYRKC